MSDIFISYSRKDLTIARCIVEALAAQGLDTWIDWEDIPKTVDWEEEIYRGIEEADAFLFMISPDSAQSEMCKKEIAHAVKNGKRIIPIVIRNADRKNIPTEVSKLNWIFCRDGQDEFNTAVEQTRKAIHTDYEWVRFHTKLQLRAIEWERHKDASRLFRGRELREAEQYLANIHIHQDPLPTDLQRLFIYASRRTEESFRRRITIGLIFGVVVLATLSLIAWKQRGEAVIAANGRATAQIAAQNSEATAITESNMRATSQAQAEFQRSLTLPRQLAAQAELLRVQNPANLQLSLLLAIESIKRIPSTEAESTIKMIEEKLPVPVYMVINSSPVMLAGFTRNGKKIITLGGLGDYLARRGGEEYFFRTYDFSPPYASIEIQKPGESTLREPISPQDPWIGQPTPIPADLSFINNPSGNYVIWNNAADTAFQYSMQGYSLFSSKGLYHAAKSYDEFGRTTVNIERTFENKNLVSTIGLNTKVLSATFSTD